jgi:hypothetical protein
MITLGFYDIYPITIIMYFMCLQLEWCYIEKIKIYLISCKKKFESLKRIVLVVSIVIFFMIHQNECIK